MLATSKAECSFQRPLIPEALSDHCALETTRERLFTLKLVIPTCTKPSHSLQPDWDFVAMWQCGNCPPVVAMSIKVWRSKTICPMAAHGQLSCARLKAEQTSSSSSRVAPGSAIKTSSSNFGSAQYISTLQAGTWNLNTQCRITKLPNCPTSCCCEVWKIVETTR